MKTYEHKRDGSFCVPGDRDGYTVQPKLKQRSYI